MAYSFSSVSVPALAAVSPKRASGPCRGVEIREVLLGEGLLGRGGGGGSGGCGGGGGGGKSRVLAHLHKRRQDAPIESEYAPDAAASVVVEGAEGSRKAGAISAAKAEGARGGA